jgi:hypothetical protein
MGKPLKYKVEDNGCFVITSHIARPNGYCQFSIREKKIYWHRYIYEECFGPIADGLVVRHKCDVRNCVNPEHLELGTPLENSRDMIERNRSSRGSKNPMATLKEEQVINIKQLLDFGHSVKEVANKYKVNYSLIYKIKTGARWSHIKAN